MSDKKNKPPPKLIHFSAENLEDLQDEALNGLEKEKFRGQVTPLLNSILDKHYAGKRKKKKKNEANDRTA